MPSTSLSQISLGPGFSRIAPRVLPLFLYILQSCLHCPVLLKQCHWVHQQLRDWEIRWPPSTCECLRSIGWFSVPAEGPPALALCLKSPQILLLCQSLGSALPPALNLLSLQLLGHQTASPTPTATRAPTSDSLFWVSPCLLDISFWGNANSTRLKPRLINSPHPASHSVHLSWLSVTETSGHPQSVLLLHFPTESCWYRISVSPSYPLLSSVPVQMLPSFLDNSSSYLTAFCFSLTL